MVTIQQQQCIIVHHNVGGVVVFAVNSLLYLNQSVPPFGVSLNSQTTGTTAFPLRECSHLHHLPQLCLSALFNTHL